MSFLEHFIKALADKGIKPLEEIHDTQGKWKRAKIEGDKGQQRTLSYRLTISAYSACASFQNHREGVCHSWYSRSASKKITEAEREAIKIKIGQQKEADEKDRQAAEKRAAEKAKRLWAGAKEGPHPYLERKGIDSSGTRVNGKILYVPMYDGKEIINLQCISDDGTKRFLTGGRKKGAMAYLSKPDEDKDVIFLAEGWATGKSIRMATGIAGVVAFDAGNLLPVAEKLREYFPNCKLVFAADNDQFTKLADGTPFNTGIEKAKAALEKVGGQGCVKSPDFPREHPALSTDRPPTDWNDFHALLGIEALCHDWQDIINHEVKPPDNIPAAAPAEMPMEEPWQSMIIRKPGTGLPKPDSLENIIVHLKYNEVYDDIFAFDEFSSMVIVRNCPPWDNCNKFVPHPLGEGDITMATASLERVGGLSPAIDKVKRGIEQVARLKRIHPPRDYFKTLKWDGVKRIDKWLAYYCGAEFDDERYVSAVGAKWLTAGIARIFEPGYKFDYILVLEGPEGARKSTMLEELATFNGVSFYTDAVTVNKLADKDTTSLLQGRMILELSELAGLNKQDMEDFKRWVTLRNDEMIKKWETVTTTYPRQFIVAATLNPAEGWLDDPTGGRRFWPVTTGNKIDIDALRKDKEQLWAEAYVRYKAGEELFLRDEIYDLSLKARDVRRVTDPWHDTLVAEASAVLGDITSDQIYRWLDIPLAKRSKAEGNRIGKIMRRIGYIYVVSTRHGRATRVWRKSETMSEGKQSEESEAA